MKTFKVIFMLLIAAKLSSAQDTAYVSRDKSTALFFPTLAKVISSDNKELIVTNKGNGVLTLKARSSVVRPKTLSVQEENSEKVYHIPVVYSYGRAGRRIQYGTTATSLAYARPDRGEEIVAQQIAAGKKANVAAHEKVGGVKARIDKITLAGNRIYLRLGLSNRSNLPFDLDFVRFYIRDRKTMDRTATHEQEIVPAYSTFSQSLAVSKHEDVAKVFAFKRFSLSDDEALYIEVYERYGNRHLQLQIKQKHLDAIDVIPVPASNAQSLVNNQ